MRTYIANKKYLVLSDSDLKNIKLLVVPEGRKVILLKLNDKKGERFFPIMEKHRPLKKAMELWPNFAKGIGMKKDDLIFITQDSGNYIIDESKNVYVYHLNAKNKIEIHPVADFCHTLSMLSGNGRFKDIVVEELGYLQNTKDFTKTLEKDGTVKIEQKISRKNASIIKTFTQGEAPTVEYPSDIELKCEYSIGDIDKYSDNYKNMLK